MIIAELIQPKSGNSKSVSKTLQMYQNEFSTNSKGSDSDSEDSAAKVFEQEHMIEKICEAIPEYSKLVISVVDTGIGIKKKDRVKLFKLFGTLQNTRQMNTQGIGLGLVISENIIKAFEGQIGVKSKYGSGTKFSFSIILKGEEPKSEKQLSMSLSSTLEKPVFNKQSIPIKVEEEKAIIFQEKIISSNKEIELQSLSFGDFTNSIVAYKKQPS